MDVDFPLHVDARGRTAVAGGDDHVRDMLELLLLTNPGERVNRPDFGGGVQALVFAPNSPELAAALEFSLQAAIQQWLGDLVDLRALDVQADDATLTIELQYIVRRTGEAQVATITAGATA